MRRHDVALTLIRRYFKVVFLLGCQCYNNIEIYHIFTIKYILFTCAIQATISCVYQDQHLRGISIQNGLVGCDMDSYYTHVALIIPREKRAILRHSKIHFMSTYVCRSTFRMFHTAISYPIETEWIFKTLSTGPISNFRDVWWFLSHYMHSNFNRILCKQNAESQKRRHSMRLLIWICTICP